MADQTRIEWCDSTFNPWIGCTRVSPACDHCYAAVSTPARTLGIEWGAGQPRRRTSPANWKLPLRWNSHPFYECMPCGWRGDTPVHPEDGGLWTCPACGSDAVIVARRRVFCASLADVFDNEVDPQWRADLLELIDATPNLDWLLLTKRIGNVVRLLTDLRDSEPSDRRWGQLNAWLEHDRPPENVWLGATICNQAEADRDIPKLLQVPAAVRFLSMEPLLGPVDLTGFMFEGVPRADVIGDWVPDHVLATWLRAIHPAPIQWVIAGGESGTDARPMHPSWVRALRDQCAAAGVPFLFKQWGEWAPLTFEDGTMDAATDLREAICFHPTGVPRADMHRPGKKAAGRTLDGREHTEFPEARH